MNKILRGCAVLLLFFSTFAYATYGSLPAAQDEREFFINEEALPFDGLPGIPTERHWGVLDGAGYHVEVPENWNGDLVIWAHGFVGNVDELVVQDHPLRTFLIANGYAWAASSYTKNYYDVRSGVRSTNKLVRFVQNNIVKPERVFLTGASMGGHVTGVAIEQFPNFKCPEGPRGRLCERIVTLLGRISGGVKYDAALPVCGVMGDNEGLAYGGNHRLVAEQLVGLPNQFPTSDDYPVTVLPILISQLFANSGAGFPNELTAQGEILKDFLRYSTGGERPVFDIALPFFQETVFGAGIGDGTFGGVTGGNVFDNRSTVYQLDADPELSEDELQLNGAILRIARNPLADPSRFLALERIPNITGRISVPVITLHTLGDLLVPFSNQQIYARRVASKGRSDLLVQRAIRDVGHCTFDPLEVIQAFTELVNWVDTGIQPIGDDVLTPDVVASPNYGCQFTRNFDPTSTTRPLIPACTAE